jgi:type IV secretory pathway ATPase VirB11/archaellum biosynthesis ATPase
MSVARLFDTPSGKAVSYSPNISQGSGGDIKETNRLLRAYLEKGTRVNVVNTDFNNQMSSTSSTIKGAI